MSDSDEYASRKLLVSGSLNFESFLKTAALCGYVKKRTGRVTESLHYNINTTQYEFAKKISHVPSGSWLGVRTPGVGPSWQTLASSTQAV